MGSSGYLRWTMGFGGLLVPFAACGSSYDATEADWGSEPIEFLEALSDACVADDFYGVLDFYAASGLAGMYVDAL